MSDVKSNGLREGQMGNPHGVAVTMNGSNLRRAVGRGRRLRADRVVRGRGRRAAPGAGFLSAERLSRANAGEPQGRARAHDRGGGGDVARGPSRVHRRIAAGAASSRIAGRCRLAGQAPVRHTGQRVAARYGLRRARSRYARLLSPRARPGFGRALAPARVLLPEGLLDVLERGQARARLGYSKVAWYPEGADGWAAAGLPLERRMPEPRP